MPELPEVETIVRDLDKKLRGKKIKEIRAFDKKVFTPPLAGAKKNLINRVIKSVKRRAKIIIIELSEKFIIIHLKMTGQLVYKTKNAITAGGHPITGINKKLPNKFTRAIFEFNDNSSLYFNDVRKFGWIKFVNGDGLSNAIKDLGVEPLSKNFTLGRFQEILSRKKGTAIKQALMDQKCLAGLGNIYADEALFSGGIKPNRKVNTLKQQEIRKLWLAIPMILQYSIKHRGTSLNNYVDARGEGGNFSRYLKVYGRAGEECKKCHSVIKKTRIAGRGTHWCDKCQK